jgi:Domain of unknown function (DUF222)/HNH endonuclease
VCSNTPDVSEAELHALSGPELLDRTRDLVAERNRIEAALARTVRVADGKQAFAGDGMATAQSWLRGHCRLSRAAAAQVVRTGRALEQLPAVETRHGAGALTADQVDVIAKITSPRFAALIEAQGATVAGVGEVCARFAVDRPHEDLVRLVHRLDERLDQDGPAPDPTEARFLSFARHADGSVTGRFHLDPLGGEKLQAALEALLQAHRPAGDPRSRAQQQADALVQLCDLHLGGGSLPLLRTTRPQIAVKIGSADLTDPGTGKGAAGLGFGGIVSAAPARQVACDAELRRYLIDPAGELLDLSRSRRRVTPGLRKAVELRDQTCVFAGCGAPASWCEVHHVVHWLFGGATSLDNSALLCERHHTQVHHGFTIERDTAGRWHTYRPDGTEILLTRPWADRSLVPRAG